MADQPVTITVRYFAAARSATGVTEEQLSVGPPATFTVGTVLDAATERHGQRLGQVLRRCSYLLDELAVHGRQTAVRDGQVLDILPPFAGG